MMKLIDRRQPHVRDLKKYIKKQITPQRLFVATLLALPALAMLGLLYRYAINLPYSDDYSLIPMFQSLDQGHIPWGMFWEQHNEHRYFFPLVILVGLARLTHWNVVTGMYLSFLTACIGFIGLAVLIRRRITRPDLSILTIFLSGIFFFSPVQAQNWLWDFQLGWFLCIACIIWSVHLVDTLKRQDHIKLLVLPGLLAFVCTFSLGGGFLAWAGGAIIMTLKRFKPLWITSWILAGIGSLGLYYINYHLPSNGITQGAYLHDMGSFVQYYFAYIGRPVSNDPDLAVFVGFCLSVAFVVALALTIYKKQLKNMSSVISMAVISILIGLLIDIARFNYGMGGALSGVHTTFSVLFTVALIILTMNLVTTLAYKKPKIVLAVIVALAMPVIVYSWLTGINDMRAVHKAVAEVHACSREAEPSEVCLYRLDSRSSQQAKEGLEYLIQHKYGGY